MSKKVRKGIAALLLATAVAVTQIPAPNLGAASSTEFIVNGTTLVSYEGTDSSVSIPRYVEKIGQNAFSNNQIIRKVVIPNSITAIEAGAFSDCENLSDVNIPQSVLEIGSGAFSKCTNLYQISVDKKNEKFKCESGALYNKKGDVLYQVFAGRKGETFTIANTVTDIEKYAFWGCSQISNIQFGNGLKEIPDYAFSNCNGLKKINIPATIERIGAKAFEDCSKLESVYISPSVVKIQETAFDGCAKVNFSYEDGTAAHKFANNFVVTNVSQTDYEDTSESNNTRPSAGFSSVSENTANTLNSDYSSADVSNVSFSQMPDGMETSENSNVMGKTKISGGQAVVFVDNSKAKVYDSASSISDNNSDDEQAVFQDSGDEDSAETAVEKYVIINNDTIADRAFYQENSLSIYQIPSGIKRIGDFSFARSNLESINIPEGVREIGYGAFYHCENLNAVFIPSSVSTIEPSAFTNTPWFENWMYGPDVDDFLVVGNGILIGYKGNADKVTIPSNVRKIAANVFEGHSEVMTISLPDRLEEIGEEAFKNCTSLQNISGGNYIEKIADRAFLNCPLETIRIPESVKSIGLKAIAQESGSGQSDSIVFLGNKLPEISYEKTATRFTNSEYRDLALQGVSVAVVNASVTEFNDTILDDQNIGFRGVICSIATEPTLTEDGSVCIKYISNNEAGIPVEVPDTVWIYGKEYTVDQVLQTAFHKEADNDAEAENDVEENTVSGDMTPSDDASGLKVTINNENYKNNNIISLNLSADGTGYEVILENNEEENRLREAINASPDYGDAGDNCITFSLSMKSNYGNIPVTKLGKERLTVTLPIYRAWMDRPILAVCLDDNGQLEAMLCKQYSTEDGSYITFWAKHFSPYALYQGDVIPENFQNIFDEKIAMKRGAEYSMDYGRQDDSPDTGDFSIKPKWLLAIGLAALAAFLWLQKEPFIKKKMKDKQPNY